MEWASGNLHEAPWWRGTPFWAMTRNRLSNQQKREAPNPTVLPVETLFLPCFGSHVLSLRLPNYAELHEIMLDYIDLYNTTRNHAEWIIAGTAEIDEGFMGTDDIFMEAPEIVE